MLAFGLLVGFCAQATRTDGVRDGPIHRSRDVFPMHNRICDAEIRHRRSLSRWWKLAITPAPSSKVLYAGGASTLGKQRRIKWPDAVLR